MDEAITEMTEPVDAGEDRAILEEDLHFHNKIDPHGRASRLSEIILGGQDGLVNTLGVLLGVAAASNSRKIVLAGGLAAMFAESVSMLAVAFTSKLAEGEFYRSERAREFRHIARVPNLERQEIRVMYEKLGFKVSFP